MEKTTRHGGAEVMADITMCKGSDCPVKEKCYRHTANENELRQSYFMRPPYKMENGEFSCEMFWANNQTTIFDQFKYKM